MLLVQVEQKPLKKQAAPPSVVNTHEPQAPGAAQVLKREQVGALPGLLHVG